MHRHTLFIPCLCLLSIALFLYQHNITINSPIFQSNNNTPPEDNTPLHGRFLHITDIHPDDIYKEGNSINAICHRPSDKQQQQHHDYTHADYAPKFGKPMAGCDSPIDLMNHTLNWIQHNLKDHIDFIVWTGDNMRHDNDRNHPRYEPKIFQMNELLTQKFYHQLCKSTSDNNPRHMAIDLIPSIGNNDVFPHNLFATGPTLQTREFYRLWHWFIPEEQQKLFNRYGSFVKEVIPGKLAVISINTLYMFKANPLANNCMNSKEPGYQLLIWFGFILQELRKRNIKVWLSGHVPPLEKNFENSCYHKFTLWTHEYRDIIIGGVYGHMNMDHFVPINGQASRNYLDSLYLQNGKEQLLHPTYLDNLYLQDDKDESSHPTYLDKDLPDGKEKSVHSIYLDKDLHVYKEESLHDADLPFLTQGAKPTNKESYMDTIRDTIYKQIAKKLSPRRRKRKGQKFKTAKDLQYKYSIVNVAGSVIPTFNPSMRIWEYNISDWNQSSTTNLNQQVYEPWDQFFSKLEDTINEEASMNANVATKREDKSVPSKMPKDLPLGPAYTPQLFSPTRFIQYFADLNKINSDYYQYIKDGLTEEEAAKKSFKYEVEYTSEDAPFEGKSLMVHDYMEIAAQLSKDDKQWKKYLHKVFGSTGYTDD